MRYNKSYITSLCIIFNISFLITSVNAKTEKINTDDDFDEDEEEFGSALEPHPDPNEEDYENMIYIGRMSHDGKRLGFDHDNGTCIQNIKSNLKC